MRTLKGSKSRSSTKVVWAALAMTRRVASSEFTGLQKLTAPLTITPVLMTRKEYSLHRVSDGLAALLKGQFFRFWFWFFWCGCGAKLNSQLH